VSRSDAERPLTSPSAESSERICTSAPSDTSSAVRAISVAASVISPASPMSALRSTPPDRLPFPFIAAMAISPECERGLPLRGRARRRLDRRGRVEDEHDPRAEGRDAVEVAAAVARDRVPWRLNRRIRDREEFAGIVHEQSDQPAGAFDDEQPGPE